MARRLQIRKGTADEHTNFTGANGELTYDETNKRIRFHDGVTVGGIPLAKVSDSGLPLGVPIWHNGTENQIPVAHVPYNGQLISRATYPAMWDKVQSTFKVISDVEWLANPNQRGCYSSGNDSTTFRMPDLNGVQEGSIKAPVLRGDGGGTVADEVKTVGQIDTDAIRNITGRSGWYYGADVNSGAFTGASAGSTDVRTEVWGKFNRYYSDFDASKVVPTAPENRMNSVYGIWICRVGDTTTEIAEPTKHAVLTGGNTFNGSQKVVGNLEVSGKVTGDIKALLNATGEAPISACRAWVCFNGTTSPPTILSSMNVSSIVLNSTGDYTVNFLVELPTEDYAVLFGVNEIANGSANPRVKSGGANSTGEPQLKTTTQLRVASGGNGQVYNTSRFMLGVIC